MTSALWNISNLDRRTSDGFVYTAHWRVSATDGDFSGSAYGTISFNGDLTTPYESLSEAQVINWVKEAMGADTVAAYEAAVLSQIEAQKHPVSASGTPW